MITLADLPNVLTAWLGPLVESPRLLMAVMMIVLVMIGTALDLTPTILIFAPVMLPIAVKAGIDPVSVLLLVQDLQLRPVGTGAFMVCGVQTNIKKQGVDPALKISSVVQGDTGGIALRLVHALGVGAAISMRVL